MNLAPKLLFGGGHITLEVMCFNTGNFPLPNFFSRTYNPVDLRHESMAGLLLVRATEAAVISTLHVTHFIHPPSPSFLIFCQTQLSSIHFFSKRATPIFHSERSPRLRCLSNQTVAPDSHRRICCHRDDLSLMTQSNKTTA